jgi:hypothetical protein
MRKLDEIIREYYIESLGMSQLDNRYPRFLQIAISGLKDLGMDLKSNLKEVELDVNSNDTVDLPSDYLDYLVIGTNESGQIMSIGVNNNKSPRGFDDCGDLKAAVVDDENQTSYFNFATSHHTKDGQFNGRSYGAGGGGSNNGTYKIYKNEGYIALTGSSATSIVMRYYATVEQVDGEFQVDEYYVEALKAWMYHKYVQRSRSYGQGEKRMAMLDYNKEKKKAEKRNYRFNIVTFVNAFRSGYRSSPRI